MPTGQEQVENRWPPGRIVAGTLVVCAVCGSFALLYQARRVFFFLFIAIVLSTALKPLVAWLERRGLRRDVAAPVLYASLLLALSVPIVVALPMLVDQTQALRESLPENYAEIREKLVALAPTIGERLPKNPPWIGQEDVFIEKLLDALSQAVSKSGVLVSGGFSLAVVLMMSFFWTIHEEDTIRSALLFFPAARRQSAGELIDSMLAKVGAYIRGQGLLCVIVGVMSLFAYLLIGLPHALILAIAAGVLEAVPVFGPLLGAVAPMALALSIEPNKVIWVIVAAVVIQQSENYLLVPRIMGHSVGVHPVVTLLAIAGFSSLAGVAGAVLAIPMAAIIQLLMERLFLGAKALEPDQPVGRDTVSDLRFEAQEIVQDVRLQVRHKETPASGADDRIEDAVEAIATRIDEALAMERKRRDSQEAAPTKDQS